MTSSTAFVLKSVEVKNWKTFTDATLNIENSGLTGIVGQNGSGKSSFVDAILWCLYGVRPDNVTNGALRRRKSDPKKEETVVKVTFSHAGQTVEVFRKMTGKNHTVTSGTFLDGKEVTIATGSTTSNWVINRLGMDAKGFRTAIIVPQKELDNLVDDRPAERRAHIEKLAGIEDMNLAVQKAREQENELAKQVKVLPGSTEAVEEAGEFLESLVVSLDSVDHILEEAQGKVDELDEKVATIVTQSADSKEKLKSATSVHQQITSAENSLNVTLSKISGIQRQISSIDDDIAGVDISQRPQLEKQYREVNEEYSRINHELANHTGNISNVTREINGLERSIATKQSALARSQGAFDDATVSLSSVDPLEALEARKTALEDSVSNANGRASSLQSLITDLEESIRVLDTHDHSGAKCPTCHSHLENPDELVTQFKKTVSSSREEIASLKKKSSDDTQDLRKVSADISKRERIEREISSSEREISQFASEIEDLQKDLKEAQEKLKEFNDFSEDEARQKITELDARKREILLSGEKIGAAEKALQKQKVLQNEKETLEAEIKLKQEEISALEEKLDSYGDLNDLDQTVAHFDSLLEQARSDYNESFRKMKDLESQKATLAERVKSATDALKREESLEATKLAALKNLEERSAISDLLDEYRKERIARIAPELSATATDLISQMTMGRFIEVIVNDDFSAGVTKDDGYEYSVYELSGGEKSIVALALRIAIGSLLTGENAGLLWLDEVLPAQDAERRDAILNVLRNLPIQQIVMINHTHEAEDIVDRVVKIVYDGEGSTIE